jgi:hypothetical protein
MSEKRHVTAREILRAAEAAGPTASPDEIEKHCLSPVLARYFGAVSTSDFLDFLTEIATNWNRNSQPPPRVPDRQHALIFESASRLFSRLEGAFAWGSVIMMSIVFGLGMGPLGVVLPWLGPGYVGYLLGQSFGRFVFMFTGKYKQALAVARSTLVFEKEKTDYWLRLHWRDLELEVTGLFRAMGYSAQTTAASNDRGVDVMASRNGEKIVIQCKQYSKRAQRDVVSELLGVRVAECASRAILICTGGFTQAAEQYAKANGVELWDVHDLAKHHCANI